MGFLLKLGERAFPVSGHFARETTAQLAAEVRHGRFAALFGDQARQRLPGLFFLGGAILVLVSSVLENVPERRFHIPRQRRGSDTARSQEFGQGPVGHLG